MKDEKSNSMQVLGAISLVLGLMIFNNYPESALMLLSVFLAIEWMAVGINLLAVDQLIRHDHP